MIKERYINEWGLLTLASYLITAAGLGISAPVLLLKTQIMEMNVWWTELHYWTNLLPFLIFAIGGMICLIYSIIAGNRMMKSIGKIRETTN